MAKEKKPFNKILLYILIGLMVLTGSINTIFNKILQKLYGKGIIFEQHHWIITFGMFLGELVSIFFYIYILFKRKKEENDNSDENLLEGHPKESAEKKEEEQNKEDKEGKEGDDENKLPPIPSNFIFFITAGCDLLATTINTFGLTYLATSMFQMMRGAELFFVCLWSKIFLKNPIYRHAILGIGSLIFGLFLVGLNSVLFKGDNIENAKNPLIGIILMLISQLFSSTEYVFQEKFIKQYDVHPFQLVGFEGLWGSLMYAVLLIIFQYSDCSGWNKDFEQGICFYYNETKTGINEANETYYYNESISRIENTEFAFKQMLDNKALLLVYIFYIVSIALYNIVGINLTKLVSSTARAVVDTVRTVFIWLFFLLFAPIEGTHETFYVLQLVGFIFVVCGTLIYNEIVTIPWFNLNFYTRDKIAERKKKEEEGEGEAKPNEDERLFDPDDEKDSKENEKENQDES